MKKRSVTSVCQCIVQWPSTLHSTSDSECSSNTIGKKEDLAAALRTHQAAVDATKSPQRDAAELAEKNEDEESTFFKKEFI